MRAALVAVALAACSSASQLGSRDTVVEATGSVDGDAGTAFFHDVSLEARVATGETAWLAAHLGDNPDRANVRDSDAVRRLAQLGPDGVLAVAEVFRVGDSARMPFARRVLERIALRRCHRDAPRAGWTLTRIERGSADHAMDPDGGLAWQPSDERWPGDAVERLRRWAVDGTPCEAPAASDGGVSTDVAQGATR